MQHSGARAGPTRMHRLQSFFSFSSAAVLLLGITSSCGTACAQTTPANAWTALGPDGGDARALAPDPKNPQHLYLGTTSSWVYETADGGKHWQRLAKLGEADDLIVDNIFVDASDTKTLVIGVWKVDERGGGIYVSHDGGKTWAANPDMEGQSVRALAQAPSNPKLYVAGTVAGVYRSTDGGQHWAKISPPENAELHEVESIAIDPVDTNTIYAGTWHLPWKTTDGGQHWSNIKNGLIDDSDVFSIIIDPHTPSVVYTSACSGIYKSENGGELYRKVQGIPATARRTRVLMQDPRDAKTVYAGTTEGLYRTADGGTNWLRLTGPDVIVNDVFVDPTDDQKLLLATDRSGILSSGDGGKTFASANGGFSQRLVQSLLVDAKQPQTLYAGVLNDKIYGGVFVSKDDGANWRQQADGLAGRDVFVLAQAPNGAVYAGTNNGIATLVNGQWQAAGNVVVHSSRKVSLKQGKRRVVKEIDSVKNSGPITGRVKSLDLAGAAWYAATAKGLNRSNDSGLTWELATVTPADYHYLDALGSQVVVGQRSTLAFSSDSGAQWKTLALPNGLSSVTALAVSEDGAVWAGGREGVFYTKDQGETWQQIKNLPLGQIDGLAYDPFLKRVLVSSRTSTSIFGVDALGSPWKYWQVGWRVHQVLQGGGRLIAASLFDGVVFEPRGEETANGSQADTASK